MRFKKFRFIVLFKFQLQAGLNVILKRLLFRAVAGRTFHFKIIAAFFAVIAINDDTEHGGNFRFQQIISGCIHHIARGIDDRHQRRDAACLIRLPEIAVENHIVGVDHSGVMYALTVADRNRVLLNAPVRIEHQPVFIDAVRRAVHLCDLPCFQQLQHPLTGLDDCRIAVP